MDNDQWILKERIKSRPGLVVLEKTAMKHVFNYSEAFFNTLQTEVTAQKEMYYSQVGPSGSTNPDWIDYMSKMFYRFKDPTRWPESNKRIGATELAKKYEEA